MIDIFCPNCDTLIFDNPTCPQCGWTRRQAAGEVGAKVWMTDLGTKLNKPHCYPVVAGSHYCLGTEDGALIALDAATGEIAWETALAAGVMAHALTTDGQRIFAGGEDVSPIPSPGKKLLALDAASGEVLWQCATQAHSLSAGAVAAGVVYFVATDGYLRAIDAETGAERWRAAHATWGPAPPVVAAGVVCAGGRGNTLFAYEAASGKRLWQYEAENWFAHPLYIDQGRLFALAWDDRLYALDVHSGKLLWDVVGERRRGFTTPPAVSKGRVYLGSRVHPKEDATQSSSYALVALDAVNGEELWRHYTAKHIFTPPMVAEGRVCFGANDGVLAALDAESGALVWQLEATSRAVTQPQLAGDLAIFGGRDGMIHAVQARPPAAEEALTPEVYLEQGQYVEAAAAYALQEQVAQAAALYEQQLDDWQKAVQLYRSAGQLESAAKLLAENEQRREAAQLYEEAHQHEDAAILWEELEEWRRARDLFEQSGNRRAYARVLEKMEEYLDAARVMQDLQEYSEAARLFQLGGDHLREADIYFQHLNQKNKAFDIWRALDEWEKEAEVHLRLGKKKDAAQVLAEHQQWDRAAELFEEIGDLEEALKLQARLENWERVALLAEQMEYYERAAFAWEKLGEERQAAQAYVEVAKQEMEQATPDDTRLANWYEQAARLYNDLFDEEQARACQRMVKKFRHLPDLEVQVRTKGHFIENQHNDLYLTVRNRGAGVARNIEVLFEGEFDVTGECYIRGVPPSRSKELVIPIRPREGHYGPSVPLRLRIVYHDRKQRPYEIQYLSRIHVEPAGLLGGLRTPTPFNVNIGEYYQSGAQRVNGDLLGGNAVKAGGDVLTGQSQKGDRVEMHRTTEQSGDQATTPRTTAPGEAGPKVTQRQVGPVRRCPICNLPTTDPEQRYCIDCGAPLPSPAVKEDV